MDMDSETAENETLNNNTEMTWELIDKWNNELFKETETVTYIMVLYLIISVIGNIIVIYVYGRYLKGKKKQRYFIPHLAVVDLVGGTIHCTFYIITDTLNVYFPGDILCKVLWYLGMVTTILSSLILLVIAIQRYTLICKPLGPQMNLKRKRIALSGVVMFSFIFSLPCFIFYGDMEVHHPFVNITGVKCGTRPEFSNSGFLFIYNILLLLIGVVGIVLLIVFYALVANTIRQKRKEFRKKEAKRKQQNIVIGQPSQKTDQNLNAQTLKSQETDQLFVKQKGTTSCSSFSIGKSSMFVPDNVRKKKSVSQVTERVKKHFSIHRFSWIFMSISIVWIVVFTPNLVIMVVESFDTSLMDRLNRSEKNAYRFFFRLFIINHIVNPIIYGLHDTEFRNTVKKAFCC